MARLCPRSIPWASLQHLCRQAPKRYSHVFLNTQEHLIVMYTLTTKHVERLGAASCISQIDDGTSKALPVDVSSTI
jgi:hypothetical protein